MDSIRAIFIRHHVKKCSTNADNLRHNPVEKALALFRRCRLRMPHDSALRDFVKLVDEKDRPGVLHVGLAIRVGVRRTVAHGPLDVYSFRVQVQHDRRLHFAGMAHSTRLRFAHLAQRFCGQRPVGGEDETHVGRRRFQLAQRGPQRCVVPTMAVQDKDLSRPHAGERLAKFSDQLDVHRLRHVERAGEMHVMCRKPRPKRRRQQHTIRHRPLDALGDRRDDVRVRCKRQMRTMLLDRTGRKDHDQLRKIKRFHLRPGQIFEQHGLSFRMLNSGCWLSAIPPLISINATVETTGRIHRYSVRWPRTKTTRRRNSSTRGSAGARRRADGESRGSK